MIHDSLSEQCTARAFLLQTLLLKRCFSETARGISYTNSASSGAQAGLDPHRRARTQNWDLPAAAAPGSGCSPPAARPVCTSPCMSRRPRCPRSRCGQPAGPAFPGPRSPPLPKGTDSKERMLLSVIKSVVRKCLTSTQNEHLLYYFYTDI